MTRAKRIFRFVAALTALWTVAGASWPIEDLIAFLGGMPCC
jgi:hypothetical protein